MTRVRRYQESWACQDACQDALTNSVKGDGRTNQACSFRRIRHSRKGKDVPSRNLG